MTRTRATLATLPPAFYARPAEHVARALLGASIVSMIGGRRAVGRIVETEAYLGPQDDASHAAARIGRTRRNATMFGAPGIAYVYRSYGIHWCLNVVTDAPDFPAAVLIRAIEPVRGIDTMRHRRGLDPAMADARLGRGPGNVCVALGITGEHDGHPLHRLPLRIVAAASPLATDALAVGPRIGITRAAASPLRFWIAGNAAVSRR
ncbi:MAG: DNA-3-methyladenine glycosylase [Longimicrobiales bacterium]